MARPQNDDFLDIPGALGLLINQSGKMRMLSHRIAMFILRARLSDADVIAKQRSRERLDAALAEFLQIREALCEGSAALRIPREAAALLHQRQVIAPEARQALDDFHEQARRLSTGQAPVSEVMAFVDFVAGTLLQCLNAITEGVSATLEHVHDEHRASARRSEATVIEALAAIEKVSMSVRLIAINAATEAVRAGEAGRGFAVIAREIRSLSDRTTELVSSVRTHLH